MLTNLHSWRALAPSTAISDRPHQQHPSISILNWQQSTENKRRCPGQTSALKSTYNYRHFNCSHWSNLLHQFLTVAPQERKNTFAIATTTAANMIPRDETLPQHLKPTQMENKRYSITKKVPIQVIVQQLTAHCRDRSRMILMVLTHRWICTATPVTLMTHGHWPSLMQNSLAHHQDSLWHFHSAGIE